MKRSILTLLLLLFLSLPLMAQSATITLAWDPNDPKDQVAKYTLYRASSANGPWAKVQDVTGTTTTLSGLVSGIYYFYVTASNNWGESAPSNIVNTPPPAGAPSNLRVTVTVQVSVAP